MIDILIIDDNDEKVGRIRETISRLLGIKEEQVDIAADLITARDLLHTNSYDLLLLDLRLPNRKGDQPSDQAGCEFVKELNVSTTLIKPYHIIGLTEYDEALAEADPFFRDELWSIIKYDPGISDWRKRLSSKLSYLVDSKRALQSSKLNEYEYDLAVLTALRLPELQSVLDLPADWSQVNQPNDATSYFRGNFRDNNQKVLSVVAASASQMGASAAAVLASKLIWWFRPRWIVMTGIAAGTKNGLAKLGDILIADQSWDYGSGKHVIIDQKAEFRPDPQIIPLKVDLRERILDFNTKASLLREIADGWRGSKPQGPLEVHVGPLPSGSGVVQDEAIVEDVKSHSRKLVGMDMETYGVYYAAENASQPRPTPISIKGVSDFADSQKSDEHQAYAAYVSAHYLYRFALECL